MPSLSQVCWMVEEGAELRCTMSCPPATQTLNTALYLHPVHLYYHQILVIVLDLSSALLRSKRSTLHCNRLYSSERDSLQIIKHSLCKVVRFPFLPGPRFRWFNWCNSCCWRYTPPIPQLVLQKFIATFSEVFSGLKWNVEHWNKFAVFFIFATILLCFVVFLLCFYSKECNENVYFRFWPHHPLFAATAATVDGSFPNSILADDADGNMTRIRTRLTVIDCAAVCKVDRTGDSVVTDG